MADLLFEIGAEEIPAGFVPSALEQLQRELARALDDARLVHGEVKALGTPRRLAVWARDVAAKQADARTEALGPPVAHAFDAEGKPTAAALGFARSQSVEVSDLQRVATPKGERLAVTKVEKGRKAEQVLPALLERLVQGSSSASRCARAGTTSPSRGRSGGWSRSTAGARSRCASARSSPAR